MIFPIAEYESIVQVDDLTRISAAKSSVTPDEDDITSVLIKPDTGEDFYEAFDADTDREDWFLDWVYASAGTKTITVKVVCGAEESEKTYSVTVLSADDDKLFASDEDLKTVEPDIMQWVKKGRATYKDVHRQCQKNILEALDREGIVDTLQEPLTKDAVIDVGEVREWSKYMALRLIFEGRSNAVDDVFRAKANVYEKYEIVARNRAVLRLDFNDDGRSDAGENVDHSSGTVVRR